VPPWGGADLLAVLLGGVAVRFMAVLLGVVRVFTFFVLTGGGDLREAQVDVPLSVSHSCV